MTSLSIRLPLLLGLLGVVASAPAAADVPLDPQTLTIYAEDMPRTSFAADGAVQGFAVDVVTELGRRTGIPVEVVILPRRRAIATARQEINAGVMPTARLPGRETDFQWVGPLLTINWRLYGRTGEVQPLPDLDAARTVGAIGVYRGDARAKFLAAAGFDNLDYSGTHSINWKRLLHGRVDLIAASDIVLHDLLIDLGFSPQRVTPVLTFRRVDANIAFGNRTDAAKVADWQAALDALHADGTYAAWYDRWYDMPQLPAVN